MLASVIDETGRWIDDLIIDVAAAIGQHAAGNKLVVALFSGPFGVQGSADC
jgi:hypothetical protein